MQTIGDVNASAGATTPWYQSLLQAGTAYLTLEQQRELLKIQTQRMAQGLPPLDASAYTPGLAVGVESGTQRTLITLAGMALVGLVAMKLLK